jgi:hypothetical protein
MLSEDIRRQTEEGRNHGFGSEGQTPAMQNIHLEDLFSSQTTADIFPVWIIDENGRPRPVIIKTGVSDNSYTEVVWGNLGEDQLIITGIEGGSGSSGDRESMRRMMMAPPPPRI